MNYYQVLLFLIITIAFCLTKASCASSCVSTPAATEGPYYESGMTFRKNITEGKPGLPVVLELTIVDKTTCEAVSGATVEIWHCDALGIYSHYEEASNNVNNPTTDDKTYLRGKQYVNSSGIATFETIYPGWYVSRDTHIHMKIFNGEKEVLTSQLFFADTLSDQVGLISPYSSHNVERTRLDEDTVYSSDDIMLIATYLKSSLEDGLIAQGTVVVNYGSSSNSSTNGTTDSGAESSNSSTVNGDSTSAGNFHQSTTTSTASNNETSGAQTLRWPKIVISTAVIIGATLLL